MDISEATRRNWKKLGTSGENRLTSRANKLRSTRRIVPFEYFTHKENISSVINICNLIEKNKIPVRDALFTLGQTLLRENGLSCEIPKVFEGVQFERVELLCDYKLPDNEKDILGAIYQTLSAEGEKNRKGSYYTPQNVVENMFCAVDTTGDILDCCCGSGAFLLSANADSKRIYGVDNDEIALMLSRINLTLKYKSANVCERLYCADFLSQKPDRKFDLIISNLPWGAQLKGESFSEFIKASWELLNDGGAMRFLLPSAFLTVKKHQKTRRLLIENSHIEKITLYSDKFNSVTTDFIDILIKKEKPSESVVVDFGGKLSNHPVSDFIKLDYRFIFLSETDRKILEKVRQKGAFTLAQSSFALGIVTGANSEKLLNSHEKGSEPVFTGKEVTAFKLKPAKKYIRFAPESFQQCAPERLYRCEKLIYRFISDRLVFAYDNASSLTLNSANALIVNIPNYSQKTACLFLNSELFSYVHRLKKSLKVLKSELCELRFPELDEKTAKELEDIADEIISGKDKLVKNANDAVYRLFGISVEEIKYIKTALS